MIARRRVSAQFSLALLLIVGLAATACGQGFTPDPYNIVGEFNRQYAPYMYATTPDTPGMLPNQDRMEGGIQGRNPRREPVSQRPGR